MESISLFVLAICIYTLSNSLSVLAASISRCSFGEYWNRVLEICRPCRDVCEPLTRPSCTDMCRDFIIHEVLKTPTSTLKTSTATETVPLQVEQIQEKDDVNEIEAKGPFILLAAIIVIALFMYLFYKNKTKRNQERKETEGANAGKNGQELQPLREVNAVQEDGVSDSLPHQNEPLEEGNQIQDANLGNLETIEDGGNQKRDANETGTVQGNSEKFQPLKDEYMIHEDEVRAKENDQNNLDDLYGYAVIERGHNCLKIKRAKGIPLAQRNNL